MIYFVHFVDFFKLPGKLFPAGIPCHSLRCARALMSQALRVTAIGASEGPEARLTSAPPGTSFLR